MSLFGSSNTGKPKPQTNSISSEEFKARLPTDDDLKKFDKKTRNISEHGLNDMNKLMDITADAIADIV